MTKISFIIMIAITISSCINKGNRSAKSPNINFESDTAIIFLPFIDTLTLRGADNTSNIIQRYDLDFEKSGDIPINKKFKVSFNYKGKMKTIMKHSDLILKSLDSNFIIKKTSDSTFNFFLTPKYKKNIIEYDASISPHRKYAINTYFSSTTYFDSDTFRLVRYTQIVKE